jgi:hypothetical protein
MRTSQRIEFHTFKPCTLGNKLALGTCTSSIAICPVIEARNENFPSIFGAEKPFIDFSKINPRICLSSHLAHTTAISAIGEFVIL